MLTAIYRAIKSKKIQPPRYICSCDSVLGVKVVTMSEANTTMT